MWYCCLLLVPMGHALRGDSAAGSPINLQAIAPSLRDGSLASSSIAGDSHNAWLLDRAAKTIYNLSPTPGSAKRSFRVEMPEPTALAYDGKLLLVTDQQQKMLYFFDPADGRGVRRVPLPMPEDKGSGLIAAISWDGTSLWSAISAGQSSSFNQINLERNAVVRSLFANCDPRGLAVSGSQLWSLCYNGKWLPALIVSHDLSSKRNAEIEMTARPLATPGANQLQGLYYDGVGHLFSIDLVNTRPISVAVSP
ncbi:MAG TPA: hypothetical protein VHQ90_10645 [Thermoanaerobaculia bacterium]|nr:hypothetical protein [Thermoanaerobaculia bacterium]